MSEVSGVILVTDAVVVRVVKVNRIAGTVTLGIKVGNDREVKREYRPGDSHSSTVKVRV